MCCGHGADKGEEAQCAPALGGRTEAPHLIGQTSEWDFMDVPCYITRTCTSRQHRHPKKTARPQTNCQSAAVPIAFRSPTALAAFPVPKPTASPNPASSHGLPPGLPPRPPHGQPPQRHARACGERAAPHRYPLALVRFSSQSTALPRSHCQSHWHTPGPNEFRLVSFWCRLVYAQACLPQISLTVCWVTGHIIMDTHANYETFSGLA